MRRAAYLARLAVVGASLACALTACDEVTELRISLDVDASLLERERVLEVLAFDEEGREIYRSEQPIGGASGLPIPAGVRVVPRSGSRGAALRFVLRAGPTDVLVERDVYLAFASGEIREVALRLDAACESASCPTGTTCACEEAGCFAPECVAFGLCEAPAACGPGRSQRCELGGYAPTCTMEEDG